MKRMFEGHRLPSSPLCLSVPLEGTDKVQGLHALERSALEEWRRSPTPTGPSKLRRYRGRRLSSLKAADLHAAARPWPAFLGREAPSFDHAFTLPGDLEDLAGRVEVRGVGSRMHVEGLPALAPDGRGRSGGEVGSGGRQTPA